MPLQNTLDGQLLPGNIDLAHQPVVKNSDGSTSTVRSLSFSPDGKMDVLIPSVAHDGSGILSNKDAISQYYRTGRHLGIFNSPDNATKAAIKIHNDYQSGAIQMKPRTPGVDYSLPVPANVQPPAINMQPESISSMLNRILSGK